MKKLQHLTILKNQSINKIDALKYTFEQEINNLIGYNYELKQIIASKFMIKIIILDKNNEIEAMQSWAAMHLMYQDPDLRLKNSQLYKIKNENIQKLYGSFKNANSYS